MSPEQALSRFDEARTGMVKIASLAMVTGFLLIFVGIFWIWRDHSAWAFLSGFCAGTCFTIAGMGRALK